MEPLDYYNDAKKAAYLKYAMAGKTDKAKEDYNKELMAIRKEYAKMKGDIK